MYQPGETGEIAVTLHIGSRQGLQSKEIKVSVLGREEPITLFMKTMIPRGIEFQPSFVYWMQGEAPVEKTVDVSLALDEMNIAAVYSDQPRIHVELERTETGGRLKLRPLGTEAPIQARISVLTDYPKDKPKSYYMHAHIIKP